MMIILISPSLASIMKVPNINDSIREHPRNHVLLLILASVSRDIRGTCCFMWETMISAENAWFSVSSFIWVINIDRRMAAAAMVVVAAIIRVSRCSHELLYGSERCIFPSPSVSRLSKLLLSNRVDLCVVCVCVCVFCIVHSIRMRFNSPAHNRILVDGGENRTDDVLYNLRVLRSEQD